MTSNESKCSSGPLYSNEMLQSVWDGLSVLAQAGN